MDLGSSTKEWRDLYVDGTANIDVADIGTASIAYLSSSLIPGNDNVMDLGSSTKEWKDLYIDGTANIDTATIDTASVGRLGSNLIPTADDTYDLGSSTFRYNEIYATSQSLSISASLSAVKIENLPTLESQARLIGTASLWLGTQSGSSNYLMVFTG